MASTEAEGEEALLGGGLGPSSVATTAAYFTPPERSPDAMTRGLGASPAAGPGHFQLQAAASPAPYQQQARDDAYGVSPVPARYGQQHEPPLLQKQQPGDPGPADEAPPFDGRLGEGPQRLTCPACGYSVETRVKKENGAATWLAAFGLCLVGCWAGCCVVPFFVRRLKDSRHECPECDEWLGTCPRVTL